MVLTLCVGGGVVVLIIAVLLCSKYGRSGGDFTHSPSPLPTTTGSSGDNIPVPKSRKTDEYRPPEFEYTVLDDRLCPKDKKEVGDDMLTKIKEKLKTMTPPSSAAFKILKFIDDPNIKNEDLASVVATDPVFSASVLKVVNSAYYGRPTEVTSVGTAILLMGYHNFRSMVLEYNLHDSLPKIRNEAQQKEYNDLWLHSTVVSACAFYLGQNVFHRHEQELATIGLLHDIGKYYLPLFDKVGDLPEGVCSCVAEDCVYGLNHAQLGAYIADEWHLPQGITSVIRYHHFPHFFLPEQIPKGYCMLSFIICLADLVCRAYGYRGKSGTILPIREEYYEMYDIDLQTLFSKELEKEIEKSRKTVEAFMKR